MRDINKGGQGDANVISWLLIRSPHCVKRGKAKARALGGGERPGAWLHLHVSCSERLPRPPSRVRAPPPPPVMLYHTLCLFSSRIYSIR